MAGKGGVLVSHPGRQHSHQAATALEHAGMLAAYWSGVPSRESQLDWLPGWIRDWLPRYAPVNLPDHRARWFPIAVALRRVGRAMPTAAEQAIDFLACRAFDRQVARGLVRASASTVVACEISALDTFRVAKTLGMTTVLDAASVHYAVQDRVTPVAEARWLHKRILGVKHAEIDLADHVLTVSEMARAGYVAAKLDASRVHAVALGADTQLFVPGNPASDDHNRPFTFLFVGATIYRKGIDLLLEAFGAVAKRYPERVRLVVVGPRGDSHGLLARSISGALSVRPAVAQPELPEIYQGADCFVLPSRHDSFGMTVIEAMACGLPAIVSEMVGAREAIEQEQCGWVVPLADTRTLTERMAWCVENRAALAAMRPAARAAAERYDWAHYGERLAEVMTHIAGRSD